MTYRLVAVVIAITSIACSRPSSPAPRPAASSVRITGMLLEKLDGPPYSYLRLKTDSGEVWAAVPVTEIDKKAEQRPVTVASGITVRNVKVAAAGRRIDTVVFGVMEAVGTQ